MEKSTSTVCKTDDESCDHRDTAVFRDVDEAAAKTKEKSDEKEVKKTKKGKDAEHMNRAIMQTLSGLCTSEEKIICLSKKYADLATMTRKVYHNRCSVQQSAAITNTMGSMVEHKALQKEVKVQQKQHALLQKERDHLQSEHGRALLAKSKLESLCRELQRHNKTIKEESLQRAKEEEEKRKEVSAKFQQTINDVTAQMQENHTRNLKLKEENVDLAAKLKSLVEQYERREEHIEKLFKHKELESQLYDAKIQQANIALVEEKDKNQREKAVLLADAADNQRKCDLLVKQESELKAQLTVYTEKFEEFQTTLTKSNEVFQTFKQEMDKMTKKIKKLENETNMWRVRWESTNASLLVMAEQKAHHERELADSRNKIVRLEKLCRALQSERNALLDKARTGGVTPQESTSILDPESIKQESAPERADQGTSSIQLETGSENDQRCNQSDSIKQPDEPFDAPQDPQK